MSNSVYNRCPMCGTNKKIHVEPYCIGGTWKLATVNEQGEACCTLDKKYRNLEHAQQHVEEFNNEEAMEELDREMQEEANAVTDEHGYFFDNGPQWD